MRSSSGSIERIVLGTILAKSESWYVAKDIVTPEAFPTFTDIAEAVWEGMSKSGKINLMALSQKLKSDEVLNVAQHVDFVDFEDNCNLLKEIWIADIEVKIHHKALTDLTQGTHYSEVLRDAQMERAVYENMERGESQQDQTLKAIQIVERAMKSDGVSGLPTGFPELDKECGGWQNGDLIILAARPGMGKTTMALTHAMKAVDAGKKVLIIQMDMPAEQIRLRQSSFYTGVPIKDLRNGDLNDAQFKAFVKAMEIISDLPIFIEQGGNRSITDIVSIIRHYKRVHEVDLVIIDYLQKIKGEARRNSTRTEEVGNSTQALKNVAVDCDTPVIALAQLSRSVESRGGSKIPQMSDLRESGEIEQEADMILFLYRPEYYGITESPDGESLKGIAQTIIAKNRNGGLGVIKSRFEYPFCDFKPLEGFEEFENTEEPIDDLPF